MGADDTKSTPPRRRSAASDDTAPPVPRPRLAIVGTSVADVVRSAGGLSIDHALAGWQVDAYLPVDDDTTPLKIIGAAPIPLVEMIDCPMRPAHVTVIAVNVAVGEQYPLFWQKLVSWFARDLAELTVWGDPLPLNMIDHLHEVDLPISGAAVAFKTHALRASGADSAAGSTESFHWGSRRRARNSRPRTKLG